MKRKIVTVWIICIGLIVLISVILLFGQVTDDSGITTSITITQWLTLVLIIAIPILGFLAIYTRLTITWNRRRQTPKKGTDHLAPYSKKAMEPIVTTDTIKASVCKDDFSKYGGIEAEMLTVDLMEGHTFEHYCADILRQNGFYNVEVTPASGDQGVDILAEKDGVKYAIQCKCYRGDLGNKSIQEVSAGKAVYHSHLGVVITNRFFTAGAREAAMATGVLLWDREKLREMIKIAKGL